MQKTDKAIRSWEVDMKYNGKPKKGGSGRPPIDAACPTVSCHFNLSRRLLEKLDAKADELGKSRAQLLRDLILIIVGV